MRHCRTPLPFPNPKRRQKVIFAWICAVLAATVLTLSCGNPQNRAAIENRSGRKAPDWFRETAAETGIDFLHQDGRSGKRYYVETAASGGGWLDYDGDGDLDLYLLNGAATPGSTLSGEPQNQLFENRQGRFHDVTQVAGVGDRGYGMGMCVGDVDADGRLDLFVTNYGPDRLYRNLGDGRFEEVSERSGVAGSNWGTSCAFGDLDGDGDLDLYVANYVDFRFDRNPRCGDAVRDIWSYCRPSVFDGQPDHLYINRGDGTFEEQGALRGIAQGPDEKGFGVVLSDLNGDGAPEILVANDGTMNRLYLNDGHGFFDDRSLESGLGYDKHGRPGSGMGLCLGDVDGDGLQDLLVTNYSFETNALYLNLGNLLFEDRTLESGLNEPSYLPVGWGAQFLDFDNDGDLDLVVANGHVMDNIDLFEKGIGYPQPNQIFVNDGTGRFRDATPEAGQAFESRKVSRGLAVGDWNGDGRLDLLVTNTNDRPELLENRLENGNHWVGFRLVGTAPNPFAIGAVLELTSGNLSFGKREVRSGGGFLSQDDLRLHFGLGGQTGPLQATVRWPDGLTSEFKVTDPDRYWQLEHPSLADGEER